MENEVFLSKDSLEREAQDTACLKEVEATKEFKCESSLVMIRGCSIQVIKTDMQINQFFDKKYQNPQIAPNWNCSLLHVFQLDS